MLPPVLVVATHWEREARISTATGPAQHPQRMQERLGLPHPCIRHSPCSLLLPPSCHFSKPVEISMKSLQPVTQMASLHLRSNSSRVFPGLSYHLLWSVLRTYVTSLKVMWLYVLMSHKRRCVGCAWWDSTGHPGQLAPLLSIATGQPGDLEEPVPLAAVTELKLLRLIPLSTCRASVLQVFKAAPGFPVCTPSSSCLSAFRLSFPFRSMPAVPVLSASRDQLRTGPEMFKNCFEIARTYQT